MRNHLAAVVRTVPARAVDALGSLAGSLARRRREQQVGPVDVRGAAAPITPLRPTAGAEPAIDLQTACRANQSLVVDACEQAGIDYFAVIEPMARGGRIAVAADDWERLTDAIMVAGAPEPISVDCWDAAGGRRQARTSVDPELRQAMLATQRLLVFRQFPVAGSRTVLGRPYGCTIERWSVGEDGTLTSPMINEVVQVIGTEGRRPVRAEVHGREVTTLPPFTTTNALAADFPIDVVIPWLDDTDPAWSARRLQQLAAQGTPDAGERRVAQPRPPSDPTLLRYTLRSIRDNLPWVGTIFLVTDRQAPPWLIQDDETVRLVDVNALLEPRGTVPTFNPGAVRAVLHHLDDLAEHYLLIESGTMIKRHLRPTDFFHANGVVRLSFTRQTLPQTNPAARSIELSARHNVVGLLHQEFGRHPAKTFAPGIRSSAGRSSASSKIASRTRSNGPGAANSRPRPISR